MPRIRSLKPDFFKDEDLAEHQFWIRILFEGLWGQADREGRLEDRPLKIKAEIFPYDKVDVERGLNALTIPKKHSPKHLPFIVRYSVDGEKYIQIVQFKRHQAPHHTEKESIIPPPNGDLTVKEPLSNSGSCDEHYQESDQDSYQESKKGGSGGIRLVLDESPKRWEGITDEDKALWAKTYPGCNIDLTLQEMIAYWDAQPPAKRKLNWKRAIVNRLKWVQDHGGTTKAGMDKQAEFDAMLDAWAAKGDK